MFTFCLNLNAYQGYSGSDLSAGLVGESPVVGPAAGPGQTKMSNGWSVSIAAMAATPCCDSKELTRRERDDDDEVPANKRMIQQRIEVKESLRSSVMIKLKTLWSWRKKVENILLLRHLAVIFRLKSIASFALF